MLVASELDFQQNQPRLHEAVATFVSLVREAQGKESWMKRSSIDNWVKIVEIVRTKASFPQEMSEFSKATICAYYISQKLIENAPQEHSQALNHYKVFREVYEFVDKPSMDIELFKKTFSDYLRSMFPQKPLAYINKMTDIMSHDLIQLQERYIPIKGWIRTIRNWELPSIERGLPEEHLCDYFGESVPLRSMANILEHIIKGMKGKQASSKFKITIEDIQNELVHAGLNFGEKSHPHYAWGSLFALPQLFQFEKEQVLAWYLVEKIAKSLQCKVCADDTISTELAENRDIVAKDFSEIYALLVKHKDNLKHPNFFKECCKYLRSIQSHRGFGGKEIFSWSQSLRDLISLYEVCEKEKSTGAELQSSQVIKLLVVGDSVSAGLRIPDNRKHERWVAQLQRLLSEVELPVKVINCSVSGFETAEGLEALPQYIKFFNPDVVVCPLGGNDARNGRDLFQVLDNMQQFVAVCKAQGIPPHRVVWGAGIPKTFDACEGYRNTFRGAMRVFENTTGAVAAPLPEHILDERNIDSDKLHFNVEIQKDIADYAFKKIEPIVRELWLSRLERSRPDNTPPSFVPYYHASGLPQAALPQIVQIPVQIPETLSSSAPRHSPRHAHR